MAVSHIRGGREHRAFAMGLNPVQIYIVNFITESALKLDAQPLTFPVLISAVLLSLQTEW